MIDVHNETIFINGIKYETYSESYPCEFHKKHPNLIISNCTCSNITGTKLSSSIFDNKTSCLSKTSNLSILDTNLDEKLEKLYEEEILRKAEEILRKRKRKEKIENSLGEGI